MSSKIVLIGDCPQILEWIKAKGMSLLLELIGKDTRWLLAKLKVLHLKFE